MPFGYPSVTGAGRSIYVPELSRSRSHELASRTGHPPDGGDPQSLGWESNLTWSTYPRHSGQHSSNLPSATPLRFFYSSKADLCSSAQASGLNYPYALNKYLLKGSNSPAVWPEREEIYLLGLSYKDSQLIPVPLVG